MQDERDERITTTFIGREFGWDRLSDVNWSMLQNTVLSARRVLTAPEKFPRADFDALERMDQEGMAFLLKGPVQHLA